MKHISEIQQQAFKDYAARLAGIKARTEAMESATPQADTQGADPNCPICKGLGYTRNDDKDWDKRGFGRLHHCDCTREARVAKKNEQLEEISGLHPKERLITLDDFMTRCADTPQMVELVKLFISDPWGFLTLWGGSGTGKTLALMALVNEWIVDHKTAVYITMGELADYIREGYGDGAGLSASQRLYRVTEAELVCIDEFEKVKESEWMVDEFRPKFLDRRYRLAREGICHTVFAMNRHPNTLPEPVQDRMREFIIFHNEDDSLRPALGEKLRREIAALLPGNGTQPELEFSNGKADPWDERPDLI